MTSKETSKGNGTKYFTHILRKLYHCVYAFCTDHMFSTANGACLVKAFFFSNISSQRLHILTYKTYKYFLVQSLHQIWLITGLRPDHRFCSGMKKNYVIDCLC